MSDEGGIFHEFKVEKNGLYQVFVKPDGVDPTEDYYMEVMGYYAVK